jgi:hypothetical protein
VAATIAGALKARIEGLGLGLVAYRDGAPSAPDPATGLPVPTVPLPYVTIREAIAATPDLDGPYDDGVPHTIREVVQVDLWQRWRDPNSRKTAEQYGLADALVRGLRGAPLPDAPTRVYGCAVAGRTRLLEPQENVVHDAITLTIRRSQ